MIIISVPFITLQAHTLQLEAFSLAFQTLEPKFHRPKLQFVGSCRNEEDLDRLQRLKERTRELSMDEYVEFHKDVMYRYLLLFNSFRVFH